MLLAVVDGVLRQPNSSGERTSCSTCGEELTGKHGDIKVWHWAHLSTGECDPWAVGEESQWHLDWKLFGLKSRLYLAEQTLSYNGERHRADLRSKDGRFVIEVQHSSLTTREMDRRTDFWGQHGTVIWIIDGTVPGWRRRFWQWAYGRSKQPQPRGSLILDQGQDDRSFIWLQPDGSRSSVWGRGRLLETIHRGRPASPIQLSHGLARAQEAPGRQDDWNDRAKPPVIPVIPVVISIDTTVSHPNEIGTTAVIPNPPDSPCGHPWARLQRIWMAGEPSEVVVCRDCRASYRMEFA